MNLYRVNVTGIGASAKDGLQDGIIIIFNERVPEDIAEYCVVHSHDELKGELSVGGQVFIDDQCYRITAIGDVVNRALANLGHITLCFDGKAQASLPLNLHLSGGPPADINLGSSIIFV